MTALSIDPQVVTEITQAVWSSVLQLPVVEASRCETCDGWIAGMVEIKGAWQGVVRLICGRAFARRAASIMFALDAEQVGNGEINDAVGELTNMIAGQIKGLAPEPSSLTCPKLRALLTLPSPSPDQLRVFLASGEDAFAIYIDQC
jgi:chemotaxis protein CheX